VQEAIIRLRLPDQERYAHQKAVGEGRPLPWWHLIYGRQRVGKWQPRDERWAPSGYVSMNDGPICEQNLRPLIVGRVVGVMRPIVHDNAEGSRA
jgi:hypothetical protein